MSQETTPTTTAATTPPTRFLGCDVGKATVVVFDSANQRTTTLANHRADLDAFLAGVEPTALLVCEATGGYEDVLLAAALVAGVPAHRADARKVKAFIRSFGILGKTDAIDARALVAYARERHAGLVRWQPADPQRDQLQALVLARRDFVDQRVAFANRRGAPGAESLAPFLDPLVACLKAQIGRIDAAIDALVRTDDTLRRDATVLRTIPGIGAITAAALLALMPELGRLDRRRIAALAGLARTPTRAARATAPGASRAGGRTSATSSSCPPFRPSEPTHRCAMPSIAWSPAERSAWSPSSPSCEKSSSSPTPGCAMPRYKPKSTELMTRERPARRRPSRSR